MKIFVTGGAGYVGSHTCKALTQSGHEVVVYDNLSTGFRELVKWGELIEGDILDRGFLEAMLAKHRPDGIIHFAAFSQVGESVSNPGKYIHNNITGTMNILEAMRICSVRNIVVSSTAAVYGIPEICPITEDMPTQPINPYGETKLFMEWMLADYAKAYGLSWMALRYFNAAGADPEGECGECHNPETHLIPRALKALTGDVADFKIMGDDYPTSDGTCIRDYIHVTDLASAHVLAMQHIISEGDGKGYALNLGTGQGVSVCEILNAIERTVSKAVPYTVGSRRAGDPPVLIADGMRAAELLQWKPVYSDIERIIADAWRWHTISSFR